MITLYLAVVLVNGEVTKTFADGAYKNPEECYSMMQFWQQADDETGRREYKCMKVTGDFVDFKLVEVKK